MNFAVSGVGVHELRTRVVEWPAGQETIAVKEVC